MSGQPGKKIPDAIRLRACELLAKGVTAEAVASRMGVSKSLVRGWNASRIKGQSRPTQSSNGDKQ